MPRFKSFSVIFLVIIVLSCGKALPALEGIDLSRWAGDRDGCQSYRSSSIDEIRRQKDELLALDEMAINKLLGKPDRHELYTRSQKFYYYSLDPGPSCPAPADSARQLVLRFNAMGLVKEVLIESTAL